MKKNLFSLILKSNSIFIAILFSNVLFAQQQMATPSPKSDFWKKVQFGGGIGLSIGSSYTDITIAPSAIYNFNQYVSAGIALQGSYISSKDYYNSFHYGASLVALFNPIEQIQLSAELEEVRVNNEYELIGGGNYNDDFWNTSLFLGAGYKTGHVTIGARYNVLHNSNKDVYNDAFMPFVRVYF